MEDVKNRILQDTEALFMRYGFKSVTMDDIARELGISKKTLYQHVENKADLIRQVVQQHIQCERQAIDSIQAEAGNAIEEMLGITRFMMQQLRQLSSTAIFDLKKYYRESWEMVDKLHQEHVYRVMRRNIERGMREGLYRKQLDADIIARLYVGKTLLVVDEELFPMEAYDKSNLFEQYINYHIRGLASPKGMELLKQYQASEE